MNRKQKTFVLVAIVVVTSAGFASASELDSARVRSVGSPPYQQAVAAYLDRLEPKVVGGAVAAERAFPWQVSLGVAWIADPRAAHFCGGTIVSTRWIVTAAHCVTDTTPEQITVTAGTNRLNTAARRHNVRRVIAHRRFDRVTLDNDIAVLELFDELQMDETHRAIPLLRVADEPVVLGTGTQLRVSGWGATYEGGRAVEELRFAEVPFVETEECNRPLAYDGAVTDNMFCAGYTEGGIDACQGDSGGPIVINHPQTTLAGAVSWGDGCARPNKVGVYTRVSRYVDWIEECFQQPDICNQ